MPKFAAELGLRPDPDEAALFAVGSGVSVVVVEGGRSGGKGRRRKRELGRLGFHQPHRWQKENMKEMMECCPEVGILSGSTFSP
ncbi:hypothetical protein F5Y17DRAFT_446425 [Xylariaceae sp. FL0594]|nr:hypothetical protein F5Y17DRAFT_446425 [Xylariaceae sp. FL0594]